MPLIHRLPPEVQNRIAAGEVLERPASAVKELVENSLDAGARHIEVGIEEGGRRLIRVRDDGRGMDEADLALCVERHTTSKIRDIDDIYGIATFGFRGEALASIAAVSRLRIVSAMAGASVGHELVAVNGKCERLSPVAAPVGTTVEVRDLFQTTPVRLKFLRSPAAEATASTTAVIRLALARPAAAIGLESNGRRLLDLPPHQDLRSRIAAIFGRELADLLAPVDLAALPDLRVSGFVARPPESRPNSANIYIILNGRWIRHPGLARIIADVYAGSLPPRRYPFAVLCLQIDLQKVDVNVHPAKEEVRFADEHMVLGIVARAVREALRRPTEPQRVVEVAPRLDALPPVPTAAAGVAENATRYNSAPTPDVPLSSKAEMAAIAAKPASELRPRSVAEPILLKPMHAFRLLGQAGNRYLILDSEEGIYILDQHALHERWLYEELGKEERERVSQRLLLPAVLDLTPAEAAAAEAALPCLRDMGFVVETFGVFTLAISAAPAAVPLHAVADIVREALADLEAGKSALEPLRERLRRALACRGAVKFGQPLPAAQILALAERFSKGEQPNTCPHGRPVAFLLRWEELQRRFGR